MRIAGLLESRKIAVYEELRNPTVLKAGTWLSRRTISAFYLQDVIHKHMDTFSIGSMLTGQDVVQFTNSFGHWYSNSRCCVFTAVCDVQSSVPPCAACEGGTSSLYSTVLRPRELQKPCTKDLVAST